MANVAVIVPVYKVEPYLMKCVDSILAQTYADFELILVDDGSPDNCGNICDTYASQDSRVHVIHQPNGGLSVARNAGLDWLEENSQAEFVTFVDSDDWVNRSYLAVLVEGALSLETDIACVGYAAVRDDYRYVRFRDRGWQRLSPERYWSCGSFSSPVAAWAKLYRRKLFENVRYPVGKINEDAFTTHRVIFQAKKIAAREIPEYNYVERAGSIMRSAWNLRRLDGMEALEEELQYFAENGYATAYAFTEERLMVIMAESLSHLDYIDKEKALIFRQRIRQVMATRKIPFWKNREFYRHLSPRTYWIRWCIGVVFDFVQHGRDSWICNEMIPIMRLLLNKAGRCVFARRD